MEKEQTTLSMVRLCLGFGLLLAISPLSSAVETVVSSMVLSARVVGWADQTVFAACFIGTIAAIARCSSKGFNVSHRAALLCAAMVAIETGMGLTALAEAGAAHDLASVLLTVSSALRGVGVAVFQVLYVCELAQASSRERHFDALLPLALVVSAVATLGMWALSFLFGPWPTIIAMTVLPIASLALFPRRPDPGDVEERAPRKSPAKIDMPLSTCVILGSFGVAQGCTWAVLYSMPGESLPLCSCLGFLVLDVFLLVAARKRPVGSESSLGAALRGVTLVTSFAFLVLPLLLPVSPRAAVFLMSVAWAAQILILIIVPMQMLDQLPVSVLSVIASGSFPVGVGVVLSSVVAGIVVGSSNGSSLGLSVITALACFCLVCSALLMPAGSFDARALGIREHLKTDDPVEHLRLRCDEVARKEGLTDREREVMFLLVQGLSRPRVAEALTVSEQTVKTHAKHIYEKLEVHSLREMVLLVETGRRYGDSPQDE